MTVPKSASQVKYELLEENKRTAIKTSYLWTAVLLVILVVCSSVIMLFTAWQHMVNISKTKDNLDFLMVGPPKLSNGLAQLSNHRGMLYAEAELEMREKPDDWFKFQARTHQHTEPSEYKRVCYYNLPNSGSFHILTPEMIDPDLCTHIVIAFATLVNGTIQPSVPSDIQGYSAVTALKKKNPKLKVMLSVEWFSSMGEFAWVVSSSENRTRFVNGAVDLLVANSLDGLDIDWEFPSWPTEVPNQRDYFTELLALLAERLHASQPPLLLSVAAGAPKPIIDHSYNITAMSQYIDFVNVMSYDYHVYQSYLPLTGANAPLFARQAEKGYFTTLNLNWTAAYWLYKGMPASKIVIGIPTYGHSYTLVNEQNHGWEAPSSGFGSTGSGGFVAYYEVCKFITQPGAQAVFDFESKVPYAFKNREWISFDNIQSVSYKAQLVKEQGFGGVMIFSLNADDVEGICDQTTKFPLTNRVKDTLQDDQL